MLGPALRLKCLGQLDLLVHVVKVGIFPLFVTRLASAWCAWWGSKGSGFRNRGGFGGCHPVVL